MLGVTFGKPTFEILGVISNAERSRCVGEQAMLQIKPKEFLIENSSLDLESVKNQESENCEYG